jgi:hypothetical protein
MSKPGRTQRDVLRLTFPDATDEQVDDAERGLKLIGDLMMTRLTPEEREEVLEDRPRYILRSSVRGDGSSIEIYRQHATSDSWELCTSRDLQANREGK